MADEIDIKGIFLKLSMQLMDPLIDLTVHLIISIVAVAFIWIVEHVMIFAQIDHKKLPFIDVEFADWMFYLDVFSVSAVLTFGLLKALRGMWK